MSLINDHILSHKTRHHISKSVPVHFHNDSSLSLFLNSWHNIRIFLIHSVTINLMPIRTLSACHRNLVIRCFIYCESKKQLHIHSKYVLDKTDVHRRRESNIECVMFLIFLCLYLLQQ